MQRHLYSKMSNAKHILPLLLLSVAAVCLTAQPNSTASRQDSLKGSVGPERDWWNILHYDLVLELDQTTRTIAGYNTITYEVSSPKPHPAKMQIDLQGPLHIDSIQSGKLSLSFTREGNVWWVQVPPEQGKEHRITIYYSGTPKTSYNPPYDGGVSWVKDSLDRPWISVSCQMVGGSVWYPCKDHYSEEPERGASLTLIVDDSLQVVGNGRLTAREKRPAGKTVHTWAVVNPINNYGLTFYIGHYTELTDTYAGEKGDLDMSYWVLDYNRQKAISHMIPEVNKTMRAFEKWWGPYPFYEDGFKMVESSYIGMEHQSAVAYGNQFKKGRFRFNNLTALDLETDRLIVHEMAHEWFGNNLTMSDIADRWVQEGFAAYGEELFIEEILGREAGRQFFITRHQKRVKNEQPLISAYGIFQDAGPDMYYKSWAIVHSLREMVNDDEKFRQYLRGLNQTFYHQTLYSRQLEAYTSTFFGRDFGPFFDQYLRHATLPVLEYRIEGNKLQYRLQAAVRDLAIPVKLLAAAPFWLEATTNWQETKLPELLPGQTLTVDPNLLLELRRLD